MRWERAAGIDQLAAAPLGHFLGGKSSIFFCALKELWGLVLFGRPDREDALLLARAFAVELADETPPHAALIDAHALIGIDPSAFDVLQAFARDNLDRSKNKVSRVAFVLPSGVSGAVVAGFYGVLGPPFPVEYVADRDAALASLGAPAQLAGPIDGALAEARGSSPLLGELAALIRLNLAAPDLANLCNRLGLSERTLQRRLAEAGTSFQKEVQGARIEEARRRLSESEDAITVIAIDLGFASSQHFSRQFRGATGHTPSEWRARHKTAAPSDESS